MRSLFVTLYLLALFTQGVFSANSYFTCGSGQGGFCGAGGPGKYTQCSPTNKCAPSCNKIVIINQLGLWYQVNETLTAINMNHPMTLTYQQVPNSPRWTLQLAPDATFTNMFQLTSINNEGGIIQFDKEWIQRPDGTKKHILAMALYAITGQCFSDTQPGRLYYSWANLWLDSPPPQNAMSGIPLSTVKADLYDYFFVSVDQQYSAQECMGLGGSNRMVAGPNGNLNNMQFLTFKPSSIKVFFKLSGPGFAGVILKRVDNLLVVPQNLNIAGLNSWEVLINDNEYISAFRFNSGPNTNEVTCVGFGITDLDGNYRDYGGCSQGVFLNPYSFAWNYGGTWMMTKKCFY